MGLSHPPAVVPTWPWCLDHSSSPLNISLLQEVPGWTKLAGPGPWQGRAMRRSENFTYQFPPFLVSSFCSSFLLKSHTRTEKTNTPECGLWCPCKEQTRNQGWGATVSLPSRHTHLGQVTEATSTAATHADGVHAGHSGTCTLPPAKPQPPSGLEKNITQNVKKGAP